MTNQLDQTDPFYIKIDLLNGFIMGNKVYIFKLQSMQLLRREKQHWRYAYASISTEKLSLRAFHRYMTLLYRHVIHRWKALEPYFSMKWLA